MHVGKNRSVFHLVICWPNPERNRFLLQYLLDICLGLVII